MRKRERGAGAQQVRERRGDGAKARGRTMRACANRQTSMAGRTSGGVRPFDPTQSVVGARKRHFDGRLTDKLDEIASIPYPSMRVTKFTLR